MVRERERRVTMTAIHLLKYSPGFNLHFPTIAICRTVDDVLLLQHLVLKNDLEFLFLFLKVSLFLVNISDIFNVNSLIFVNNGKLMGLKLNLSGSNTM